jgi:hypothetical protein
MKRIQVKFSRIDCDRDFVHNKGKTLCKIILEINRD